MLTTTFARLHAARACEARYKHLGEALGGITVYGKEMPITFLQILEHNGLDDALWAFRAATEVEEAKKVAVAFAIECAERVLPIFEEKYPEDKRPREAIEAARKFLIDGNNAAARAAADAAYAAARAAADAARAAADAAYAAAYAAADAAYAAARAAADAAADAAAEKEWQKETLIRLLTA